MLSIAVCRYLYYLAIIEIAIAIHISIIFILRCIIILALYVCRQMKRNPVQRSTCVSNYLSSVMHSHSFGFTVLAT